MGPKLGTSVTFDEHIKTIKSKVKIKTICLLWKLNNPFQGYFLTTIYKSFVRPHLDYGDVIFEPITIPSKKDLNLFSARHH